MAAVATYFSLQKIPMRHVYIHNLYDVAVRNNNQAHYPVQLYRRIEEYALKLKYPIFHSKHTKSIYIPTFTWWRRRRRDVTNDEFYDILVYVHIRKIIFFYINGIARIHSILMHVCLRKQWRRLMIMLIICMMMMMMVVAWMRGLLLYYICSSMFRRTLPHKLK